MIGAKGGGNTKKLLRILKEYFRGTNWDGVRCFIKGDANVRDTMRALKAEKEYKDL